MPDEPKKPRSAWMLGVASVVITLGVCLVLGEILVRIVAPRDSLYPRYGYSAEYGLLPFANTRIVHEVPGRWRFVYTTNRFGHRGPEKPISNAYAVPHVVVLGDSYSFGIGVADGEEYASVMQRSFGDRAEVVNLSSGGWGITQEIRRFYELGQLYQPRLVILEFCVNDPSDDALYPVTAIRDGRFVFRPSTGTLNLVKKYLADSLVQKSQLYNLLRYALYDRVIAGEVGSALEHGAGASDAEREYIALLELFARDLQRRQVPLVMFAVDDGLAAFPYIRGKVAELEAAGLLRYVDAVPWVGRKGLDLSPEGHWGPRTQRAIGEGLAEAVAGEVNASVGATSVAIP